MTAVVSNASHCDPSVFSAPTLYGVEISNIDATLVFNYTYPVLDGWRYSQPSDPDATASFCNVTITYTHPSYDDSIGVELWLPLQGWNERLQAIGGGGWAAGRFVLSYAGMLGAVADGYATVSTDAGVDSNAPFIDWIVNDDGNMNLVALESFGYTSLHEQAIIAKHTVADFYGKPAAYSYWNGCSNGGRQAMQSAQRYPRDYDGIIAAAPAKDWAELIIGNAWAGLVMGMNNQYPFPCELDELTRLGISACDELDGVADGLIADTDACRATFDPFQHVNSSFACSDTGKEMQISHGAANVANAIWSGPVSSSGEFIWYGFEIGTDLKTIAPTTCNNGTCTSASPGALEAMYEFWVGGADDSSSSTKLRHEDFDFLVLNLKKTFASNAEANITNLDEFERVGGKMLTYHGLADQSIPSLGSRNYYQYISEHNNNTSEFYRYFEVPGLAHCFDGKGGQPVHLFDQLRAWVEDGDAPSLSPVTVTRPDNSTQVQILCAWPSKAVFDDACIGEGQGCWSCE